MSKYIKQIEIATHEGLKILDLGVSCINVTWEELKEMRNAGILKPGSYYRITDFVTTVANDPEARSANHPFDLIVLASDENTLQEEAFATPHEGDTYFKDCQLNAWKVWYCLDNDTTRFQWADTTNGKGVIYRLVDEWRNDCPYDFKNVQFKRYKVEDNSPNGELADLDNTYCGYNGDMQGLIRQKDSVWAYTFSIGDRQSTPIDASIIGYNNNEIGDGYGNRGYYGDNIIKPTTSLITNDNETNSVFCLNNIVWWTNNGLHRSLINGNYIESECFNMTLSGHGTLIGYDCRCFVMGDRCLGNTFGYSCELNSFGNNCCGNSFGDSCNNNSFGDSCNNNSFGYSCNNNSFGNNCCGNTFGNSYSSNTFGNYCNNNSFGNNCCGNTFGNSCNNNMFGYNCNNNLFGNDFKLNTLGNDVWYIRVLTDNVYHVNILNGTKGVIGKLLTITFETEKDYCQFAGFDSNGDLQVWVDANLGKGVINGGNY